MTSAAKSPLPHAGFRPVIAIIGNRNAGKSSLLNALTGQNVSIISNTPGTTTDAVLKTFELIPFGAVSFYDTAGLDDEGELGQKRITASQKIINRADLILYVIGKQGLNAADKQRLKNLNLGQTPFIPVFNFADEKQTDKNTSPFFKPDESVFVSAKTGFGIDTLKQKIITSLTTSCQDRPLLKGLIKPNDTVVLVTPIDLAAPKGRLIMPQVQALREILDSDAIALVTKENTLSQTLSSLSCPPNLVITDSQVVKTVDKLVNPAIPLTTFSMLFARAKGDFSVLQDGLNAIENLKDGDQILIAEGCSHHITCDDIGRVKIPALLKNYTKKDLRFDFLQGYDFPDNLSKYALIIHCGGCILNSAELRHRLKQCKLQDVPVTNYGMLISKVQNVYKRTSAPLENTQS